MPIRCRTSISSGLLIIWEMSHRTWGSCGKKKKKPCANHDSNLGFFFCLSSTQESNVLQWHLKAWQQFRFKFRSFMLLHCIENPFTARLLLFVLLRWFSWFWRWLGGVHLLRKTQPFFSSHWFQSLISHSINTKNPWSLFPLPTLCSLEEKKSFPTLGDLSNLMVQAS